MEWFLSVVQFGLDWWVWFFELVMALSAFGPSYDCWDTMKGSLKKALRLKKSRILLLWIFPLKLVQKQLEITPLNTSVSMRTIPTFSLPSILYSTIPIFHLHHAWHETSFLQKTPNIPITRCIFPPLNTHKNHSPNRAHHHFPNCTTNPLSLSKSSSPNTH